MRANHRRLQRARYIAQDPISVVLLRTTRTAPPTTGPGRGGRTLAGEAVPQAAITARLVEYHSARRVDDAVPDGASLIDFDYRHELVCDWNADVQASSDVTDEFTLPTHPGKFRVAEVKVHTDEAGTVWGKTAVLTRMA